MPRYVLEMLGIKKAFDASQALKGVDFLLEQGEIHALIGENGAGKTTLMNILGGVIRQDAGRILVEGEEVFLRSPADSKASGISFIHQELNLVNDLAVFENMFLGSEIMKHGFVDNDVMCRKTSDILQRMNVNLDPRTLVKELDASYKQVVEIARALLRDSKIIIMDEPTTSLTEVEIHQVFKMMKTLKRGGVSIVFISHKLQEVIQVCDSYTVLRDGLVVSNGLVHEETASGAVRHMTDIDLARHMVGRDVLSIQYFRERQIGEVILEASKLTYKREFRDIDFAVRKGEVVGFAGLLGDGRCELFECIFGCRKGYKGTIRINGDAVRMSSPMAARRSGLGYVPRNRKENAIIKDMSILHNASIVTISDSVRFGFIRGRFERAACLRHMTELNIRMGAIEDLITSLSGGNQQKVVLVKWLEAHPRILIFDNPTQGVDVGAKNEIYSIIMKLALTGVSIVILSSEASEIIKLCDRAYVMYHGEIHGVLERRRMTEENMMILATGGQLEVDGAFAH